MDDYYFTLQALSSLSNSLLDSANVILASNTSKQDRKFSREMSNLAWQRNLEAWNMQNEYNLPVNQYRRQLDGLMANGLNPNLVYGSSSSIGGSAGSVNPFRFENIHSTSVPRFSGVDPVQNVLSTRLLQTQVQAQEANNRLLNARADNEEARLPGTRARSDELAYRWNYIVSDIADTYEAGIRAQESEKYWKSVNVEYNAHFAKDRSTIEYYEAVTAEWLNTAIVPGTHLTYRQYLEQYKAFMTEAQYENVKRSTLNMVSQMAYRKKQGEMLDLKMEYQHYVNKFAAIGRTLGNDWVTLLISGLMALFEDRNNPAHMNWEKPKSPSERGASEPGDW